MINRSFLFLNFLLLNIGGCLSHAENSSVCSGACDGTVARPCIVQDTKDNETEVKHWRTAQDIAAAFPSNTTGLSSLWMSGSAIPTSQGWQTIKKSIQEICHTPDVIVIDVDLRQEDHAYNAHNALTLAAQNDWINLGKTREESLKGEQAWIQELGSQKEITVLTPEDFKKKEFSKGAPVPVSTVASEEKIATDAGFIYFRLTVSDHTAPMDDDVDRFIDFLKTVKPNTWLHFHCRGGDGRTTTFMAMYDMLKNADRVSLEDIIARQKAVAPHYDLFKINHLDNPELVDHYTKRTAFIRKFYQFAQAYIQGYQGSWSSWKAVN
jgi:hypothetical protein